MQSFMKLSHLVLVILLLPLSTFASVTPDPLATMPQESLPDVEIDFDKVLNLDELEEEMVKMNIMDSIKPIAPHPVVVWIRIIGCPLANAYLNVRRVIRNSMHKIASLFYLKTRERVHEESVH